MINPDIETSGKRILILGDIENLLTNVAAIIPAENSQMRVMGE
jgi:hypothetical protein